MSFERFVADHAVAIALAFLATLFIVAALMLMTPARAQQIEIGPGGIRVDPLPGHHRNWGRTCEELRLACQYKAERGEEGMGNCRRYRDTCER
jgi:hypothetical protein